MVKGHGNGFKDLSGQRFGRLFVLRYAETRRRTARWECRCDCGNIVVVDGHNMRSEQTQSCGCLLKERITKHGHSSKYQRSRAYSAWLLMRDRCGNPRHKNYRLYGGRGIRVHAAWDASFEAFLRDVGQAPSARHSLDRIDPEGHYEPGNVRWATTREQSRNRRNNVKYTYRGESLVCTDWARRYDVPEGTLRSWFKKHGIEGAIKRCELLQELS